MNIIFVLRIRKFLDKKISNSKKNSFSKNKNVSEYGPWSISCVILLDFCETMQVFLV